MVEKLKKIVEKQPKYPGYKIHKIENGQVSIIDEKDILDNDYALIEHTFQTVIIDRDKRAIRPYVENLISEMNIETKNTKMIKISMISSIIIVGAVIFMYFRI